MNTTPSNSLFLKNSISRAFALSKSKDLSAAYEIGDILRVLHHHRAALPESQQAPFTKTIFKIHDHTFYCDQPFARQQAQIATICGFINEAPQNMDTLRQLTNRMALVQDPSNMKTSFKHIIQHVLNTYENQNYQQKDTDLAMAYRLKALIQIMANIPSKKTPTDLRWLHESAAKLEQIQPKIKGLTGLFPPVAKKSHGFHPRDTFSFGEAVCTYSGPKHSFKILRDDRE